MSGALASKHEGRSRYSRTAQLMDQVYTRGMVKRGYSREFRPHGQTGKRYLLDQIPAGLWADVKVKAKRDGVSLRALILRLLTQWLNS